MLRFYFNEEKTLKVYKTGYKTFDTRCFFFSCSLHLGTNKTVTESKCVAENVHLFGIGLCTTDYVEKNGGLLYIDWSV